MTTQTQYKQTTQPLLELKVMTAVMAGYDLLSSNHMDMIFISVTEMRVKALGKNFLF